LAIPEPVNTPHESPIAADLREKILAAAGPLYDRRGCHGLDHALRVEKNGLELGRKLGARLDIICIAALLHDIGRVDEHESRGKICHAAIGAQKTAEILSALGVEARDIELIAACVRSHRFRNRHDRPEHLEAKILFDADKLDSLGAVGIGRAFLFAGQVGARLHNSEIDIRETVSYSREDTAWREFEVKLKKIPERMLTEPGRKEALRRREFMDEFFHHLDMEIYGEQL